MLRNGHLEVIALDTRDVIQFLPSCQSILQDVANLDLHDWENRNLISKDDLSSSGLVNNLFPHLSEAKSP